MKTCNSCSGNSSIENGSKVTCSCDKLNENPLIKISDVCHKCTQYSSAECTCGKPDKQIYMKNSSTIVAVEGCGGKYQSLTSYGKKSTNVIDLTQLLGSLNISNPNKDSHLTKAVIAVAQRLDFIIEELSQINITLNKMR